MSSKPKSARQQPTPDPTPPNRQNVAALDERVDELEAQAATLRADAQRALSAVKALADLLERGGTYKGAARIVEDALSTTPTTTPTPAPEAAQG
jgi:hypothetical protein